MKQTHAHFSPLARALHWTMAPLIIAMLFVGVGMVATVSHAHNTLIAIHKPLGSPPLPVDMPAPQRIAARLSHLVLYALMAAMPLIGWAMLSAAGYPITLYGPLHLPPIAPHNVELFAVLRALHTWLAFALFATVLLHLAAALFHGLIRLDGVFSSMARGAR
jgi:cytochrome b561